MSDHLAIAGVSRTLRTLLRDRMRIPVPVTLAPPDVTITALSDRRVNLYLFKVSENGHLKNQEIPGHGHPAQYGRPPLSLNLHYLLTTHVGAETTEDADLQCQAMLGDAMRVLHDYATIPESLAGLRLRVCRIETDGVLCRLPADGRRTEAAYLRLALPAAFRHEYRRLLYLDSDVFPQDGDWQALLSLDLGGRAIGAVRDNLQWRRPRRRRDPITARHRRSGSQNRAAD